MIPNFKDFLLEERSIRELPAREERPMVQGIAQILKGVRALSRRST
jgi:hypothetical protein